MLVVLLIVLASTAAVEATFKKGFGLCGAQYHCGDTYALSDTTWWYNWHPTRSEYHNHRCSKYPRGDFVPMIWGERDMHASIPADTKYLLGFNEPNALGKSYITPERAAQLWPEVEKKAGSRLLISPGLTSCDSHPEWCIGWFNRFFKACPKCRVNHMAVHAYQCDPYKIMQSLDKIHKQYGKKIWLTEFACDTSHSVDAQIKFLKTLIPLLERAPFVYRYAWFCSRLKDNNKNWNMLDMHTPSLNKLGQVYNTLH